MPKFIERRALRRQRILRCGLRWTVFAISLTAVAFGSRKFLLWTRSADSRAAVESASDPVFADLKDVPKQRAVYRYSVIPGGVETAEELDAAIHKDPVVAEHYRAFNMWQASLVSVESPKLVHVSYRIKDKVYWTRNKLRLPAGEQLIGDGQELARTRCGNQVSEAPREPTLEVEPAPDELDMPEPFVPPALAPPPLTIL